VVGRADKRRTINAEECWLALHLHAFHPASYWLVRRVRCLVLVLTPSLPWCHVKTTDKSAKFETLKPLWFPFRQGMWTDFHQNAQHSKQMCYMWPENGLILRCVEVLQAGAVKGLTLYWQPTCTAVIELVICLQQVVKAVLKELQPSRDINNNKIRNKGGYWLSKTRSKHKNI